MKTKVLLLIAVTGLLLTGLSINSCSPNDDGGSTINDLFIPDFSNEWLSNRTDVIFFFNPDTTNVNQGTFGGSEQTDSGNFIVSGKFKNYDVQFTFTNGAESGVTYSGKFVKSSTTLEMQLKGTNGKKLNLTKHN